MAALLECIFQRSKKTKWVSKTHRAAKRSAAEGTEQEREAHGKTLREKSSSVLRNNEVLRFRALMKALLYKLARELGCCLQGKPKTEATGLAAGSKETAETQEGEETHAEEQHTATAPGQERVWRWRLLAAAARGQVFRERQQLRKQPAACKQKWKEQKSPRLWGLKWLQKSTPSRTQTAGLKALSQVGLTKTQSGPKTR